MIPYSLDLPVNACPGFCGADEGFPEPGLRGMTGQLGRIHPDFPAHPATSRGEYACCRTGGSHRPADGPYLLCGTAVENN